MSHGPGVAARARVRDARARAGTQGFQQEVDRCPAPPLRLPSLGRQEQSPWQHDPWCPSSCTARPATQAPPWSPDTWWMAPPPRSLPRGLLHRIHYPPPSTRQRAHAHCAMPCHAMRRQASAAYHATQGGLRTKHTHASATAALRCLSFPCPFTHTGSCRSPPPTHTPRLTGRRPPHDHAAAAVNGLQHLLRARRQRVGRGAQVQQLPQARGGSCGKGAGQLPPGSTCRRERGAPGEGCAHGKGKATRRKGIRIRLWQKLLAARIEVGERKGSAGGALGARLHSLRAGHQVGVSGGMAGGSGAPTCDEGGGVHDEELVQRRKAVAKARLEELPLRVDAHRQGRKVWRGGLRRRRQRPHRQQQACGKAATGQSVRVCVGRRSSVQQGGGSGGGGGLGRAQAGWQAAWGAAHHPSQCWLPPCPGRARPWECWPRRRVRGGKPGPARPG